MSHPSISKQVLVIAVSEKVSNWQKEIKEYLEKGVIPSDKKSAMPLKTKAARFTLINGALYERGFMRPLLQCISEEEGNYILREIHEGICGSHSRARVLAHKEIQAGFYWPHMSRDSMKIVQNCDKCQCFADNMNQPPEELSSISSP